MSILKVARLGHPVLRLIAEPLPGDIIGSSQMQTFFDDLVESMIEMDGVGLAAPQVHKSIRVVVYQLEDDAAAPRVLINPVITPLTAKTETDWEGCLSIPDMRGKVPRPSAIKVEALDRNGQQLEYEAKKFHARVILHECDHLDGKVYLDRMEDMSTLTFVDEHYKYGTDSD